MNPDLTEKIFSVSTASDFSEISLEIFNYQAGNNPVYGKFIRELATDIKKTDIPEKIPFIPIGLFKNHKIITGNIRAEFFFQSSGTTGSSVSRHYVADHRIYERSFLEAFKMFYGNPSEFLIAALIPLFAERKNSSLAYMVRSLIGNSGKGQGGFYMDYVPELISIIEECRAEGENIMIIGLSYALLDLAEKYHPDLSGLIVVETGGMKGRRKEMTRSELHDVLKKSFNLGQIHSEYGMTELFSQAWSKRDGIFYCPPWMKVLIRDPQDPLTITDKPGMTGGINIIDLANIHSCSFIATGDLGRLNEDGSFEVLGRFDNTDIRGCNLMIQ